MDIELVVWMVRDASQKTPDAAASAADASGKSADDDDAGQSTIYYHPQALYVLRPLLPAVCGADCGSCGCRAKPTSVRRVVCATPEWLQVHADAKNGPTPAPSPPSLPISAALTIS